MHPILFAVKAAVIKRICHAAQELCINDTIGFGRYNTADAAHGSACKLLYMVKYPVPEVFP